MPAFRTPPLRPLGAALALALGSIAASPVQATTLLPPAKAAAVAAARAAPHTQQAPKVLAVSNCADSGSGSLRAALASASSGDTINLTQLACSRISLTTGALQVSVNDLTLAGPTDHHLVIDGGYSAHHYDNAIVHSGSGELKVNDLLITDAKYKDGAGLGGCIWSNGSVTLTRSEVLNCIVANSDGDATGGGIWANAGVGLVDSRVSDNLATSSAGVASGAGIYSKDGVIAHTSTIAGNLASGSISSKGGGLMVFGGLYLDQSTLSGNQARIGGALFLDAGSVQTDEIILNSTISGNRADDAVGGVFARIAIEIDHSTIAFNTAHHSGTPLVAAGVYLEAASHIDSTIIVGNQNNGSDLDVGGTGSTNVSGNHNMLGSFVGVTIEPQSIVPGSATDLLPLADNGGNTRTHALAPMDIAINGANATSGQFDQRGKGFRRTVGSAPDIGAYEFDADIIFVNGFN